jgi:succinate dehydrogenase / fumarate reductase cytochrome b subunit
MSEKGFLQTSLVRKYWMAATGLFLCLFLVGHLLGNLQLFASGEEGRLQFNAYAHFMTSNPIVKILSYLTYISIIFHAIDGLILTLRNQKARPVKYAYEKPGRNSIWSSRNMGILGTVLLIFIITHMMNFWYVMHWGPIGTDSAGNKDLYEVVLAFFKDESMGVIFTLLYVLSMLALGYHLVHGFGSGFQSLGVNHPKYNGFIKNTGIGFAILVPLLFAAIPLYIHFVM